MRSSVCSRPIVRCNHQGPGGGHPAVSRQIDLSGSAQGRAKIKNHKTPMARCFIQGTFGAGGSGIRHAASKG